MLWQIYYFYSFNAAEVVPDSVTGKIVFSNDNLDAETLAELQRPVEIDDSLYLLSEDDFLQLVVDFTLTSKSFK